MRDENDRKRLLANTTFHSTRDHLKTQKKRRNSWRRPSPTGRAQSAALPPSWCGFLPYSKTSSSKLWGRPFGHRSWRPL